MIRIANSLTEQCLKLSEETAALKAELVRVQSDHAATLARLKRLKDMVELEFQDLGYKVEDPRRSMLPYENKIDLLYRVQEGACVYCNRQINKEHMTKEHLIPKSYGGTENLCNLCLVCKRCNNLRGNSIHDPDFQSVVHKRIGSIWWAPKLQEQVKHTNNTIVGQLADLCRVMRTNNNPQ